MKRQITAVTFSALLLLSAGVASGTTAQDVRTIWTVSDSEKIERAKSTKENGLTDCLVKAVWAGLAESN